MEGAFKVRLGWLVMMPNVLEYRQMGWHYPSTEKAGLQLQLPTTLILDIALAVIGDPGNIRFFHESAL
jgi:hypothetical protein